MAAKPAFKFFQLSEHQVQRGIVEEWGLRGRKDVLLIHICNELADTMSKRIRQAEIGMWPGAPDLIFVTPRSEPLAFLEVKGTAKKIRRAGRQASARDQVTTLGHRWAQVNNIQAGVDILRSWGLMRL